VDLLRQRSDRDHGDGLTERKIVNVFAKDPEPIDVPGLVTFSLALFLLIFG